MNSLVEQEVWVKPAKTHKLGAQRWPAHPGTLECTYHDEKGKFGTLTENLTHCV